MADVISRTDQEAQDTSRIASAPTTVESVSSVSATGSTEQDDVRRRIEELEKQAEYAETFNPADYGYAYGGGVEPPSPEELRREADSARAKAQLLREQLDVGREIARVEESAKSPDWEVDAKAFAEAKTALAESESTIKALTSEELSPFVKFNKDGSYSIDVDTARKIGVSENLLKQVGVTQKEVEEAEGRISRGEKAPVPREEYERSIAATHFIQQQELKRVKKDSLKLGDGQWMKKTELASIRQNDPQLYDTLMSDGARAGLEYLDTNYTKLPDGNMVSNQTLAFIKDGSPHAYELITKKGFDEYNAAVNKAVEAMAPFKRSLYGQEGYSLMAARNAGVSKDEASLLFSPTDIEKWWRTKPSTEPQDTKVSGIEMSPALVKILTAGTTVAVVEPTPIGEIVVLAILGGWAAYTAYKNNLGEKILASVRDIAASFKAKTGREISIEDVTASSQYGLSAIKPLDVTKVTVVEPLPRFTGGIQPVESVKFHGGITPVESIKFTGGVQPVEGVKFTGGVQPVESIKFKGGLTTVEPKVKITKATATKTRIKEEDLLSVWGTIRPRVVTTEEMDRYLPATLPKTVTSLARLDKAVSEAYVEGKIDDTVLKAYQAARTRYAKRHKLIGAAIQAQPAAMRPSTIPESVFDAMIIEIEQAVRLPYGGTAREWEESLNEATKNKVDAYFRKIDEAREKARIEAKWPLVKRQWIQEMARVVALQKAAKRAVEDKAISKEDYKAYNLAYEAYSTRVAALEIIEIGIQAYTRAFDEAASQTEALQQAKAATETAVREQIETETDTQLKQALQTKTQTLTDIAIKAATAVQTRTATRVATAQVVRSASAAESLMGRMTGTEATAEGEMAREAERVSPGLRGLRIKLPKTTGGRRRGSVAVPPGSVTWVQGWDRKYIPPPYDQPKPISLGRSTPVGATKTGTKPRETLEIIGSATGVPKRVDVDLGFVDIAVRNGRQIEFTPGGLDTDVGTRIASTTRGMSVNEGNGESMDYENEVMEEQGQEVAPEEVSQEEALAESPSELAVEEPSEPEQASEEVAEEAESPEVTVAEKPKNSVEDLAYLTKVTKEDVLGKEDGNSEPGAFDFTDLATLSPEDERDLFDVSEKDVMGEPPVSRKHAVKKRKVVRRYTLVNRPTDMGGLRY